MEQKAIVILYNGIPCTEDTKAAICNMLLSAEVARSGDVSIFGLGTDDIAKTLVRDFALRIGQKETDIAMQAVIYIGTLFKKELMVERNLPMFICSVSRALFTLNDTRLREAITILSTRNVELPAEVYTKYGVDNEVLTAIKNINKSL